jgi:hypothetical protein
MALLTEIATDGQRPLLITQGNPTTFWWGWLLNWPEAQRQPYSCYPAAQATVYRGRLPWTPFLRGCLKFHDPSPEPWILVCQQIVVDTPQLLLLRQPTATSRSRS